MQEISIGLLRDIVDFQPTMILLTDGKEMLFANRALLDFFKVESLDLFKQRCSCVCERFENREGFLANKKPHWISEVLLNQDRGIESYAVIVESGKEYVLRVKIRTAPSDDSLKIVNLEDISEFYETKILLENNNRLLESKIRDRTWELLESAEELEKSKEILEDTQSIAKLGSWIYTVADRSFKGSKEFYLIFGYPVNSSVNLSVFLGALYKEDRRKLFQYLKKLKSGSDGSGINLKIIDLNKQEKIVRFYAKLYMDDFGAIYRIQGALQDITESMELRQRAFFDHLTQIYNRRRGTELLEDVVHSGCSLGLIMFDIDHFKSINDTYGHPVGDSVLIGISKLLKNSLDSDSIFVRWGGEEFLIGVPNSSDDLIYSLAEKLRLLIEAQQFNEVGRVTCSFGVIVYRDDESFFEGIKRSDDALYLAKRHGRNCVVRG